MEEMLILVDDEDNSVGPEEKLFVHQQGLLHRAFSIFVFDSKGRMLLQQRDFGKYHSAGLWTNSCCGHPRWGEATDAAARRRLQEEMGFSTPLVEVSSFVYRDEVPGNLIEHEFDHVYAGLFDGEPEVNRNEVADWLWVDTGELVRMVKSDPDRFTVWFNKIVDKFGSAEMEGWMKLISR